jgi:hypothetical protein
MKAVYLNALKLTGESHLQSFQFKPNHIIRYTNKLIMKCETFHSTFCNDTVEDIEHLFLDCHYTNKIWIYLLSCIRENFNVQIEMDPFCLLFNC